MYSIRHESTRIKKIRAASQSTYVTNYTYGKVELTKFSEEEEEREREREHALQWARGSLPGFCLLP